MVEAGAIAVAVAGEHGRRPPRSNKQGSSSSSVGCSLRATVFFFITSVPVVVVLQVLALQSSSPFSSPSHAWDFLHQWRQVLGATAGPAAECRGCGARGHDNATWGIRDDHVIFLPLKDIRLAAKPMEGTTWFMSSLNDTYEGEEPEYLHFPSAASKGRLLCLAGNNTSNGTQNSYALAWANALPRGAALRPGLTFVSDTYYDYKNLWHGLAAMMPFLGWHTRRGCVRPARWVLYHRGELRTAMGYWVRTLTEIALGKEVMRIEDFADRGGLPTCFEEAVVFRHNEGVMSRRRAAQVYDLLRCRARAFCNATSSLPEEGGKGVRPLVIRMTLLLRRGARSFKNESAVIDVFGAACGRFQGCLFRVAWANEQKTFCDQVRLLSATDVLLSPHGAQLGNLIFMDRNSSVMEFFPKGWLEFAGEGQYVFRWVAAKSGMRHLGAWRDPNGVHCPFPPEQHSRCFHTYFKDQQLGHDEAHFATWASVALGEMRMSKLRGGTVGAGDSGQLRRSQPTACGCA